MRALVLLILGLAACGGAKPAAPPREVMTGDSLPRAASNEPSECRDDGGYQWLASDPHVPFAVSSDQEIVSAADCCAA